MEGGTCRCYHTRNPRDREGGAVAAAQFRITLAGEFSARQVSRMAREPIKIEYGTGMSALETLLGAVTRPGAFYVCGREETALPRLVIDGVGQISFPVPASQAKEIVAAATVAPYGRGTETVVDPSVRKVWQLIPDAVKIGGKAWETTFAAILGKVCAGMGCNTARVCAELYKLLVYDKGGFFLSHRDTEKTPGMFGTLVVSLPSAHEGGDLVIRHAGAEQVVSLAGDEPSEVAWAAFYADCEHEVKPVTKGFRVCLVYNLIQRGKKRGMLAAPDVSGPAKQAAKLIRAAFEGPAAPVKLAWLLEHQYSPAELSFSTLKNADAARAAVLCAAAELAKCDVHLGIVHIEESGGAELSYDSWSSRYGRGRSRWSRRYSDDDEEEEEKASGGDYEITDVCDSEEFIDSWMAPDGKRPAYGEVPLSEGELLPAGALDSEKPDKDRVTEATGNEGASYERSYHRAVLVLWPSRAVAAVLLQAGPEAVVPHLKKEVSALLKTKGQTSGNAGKQRKAVLILARRMVDEWPVMDDWRRGSRGSDDSRKTSRAEMLRTLNRLGESGLIAAFIQRVLEERYDGTENEALKESAAFMDAKTAGTSLDAVVRKQLPKQPLRIVKLLTLLAADAPAGGAAWGSAVLSAVCEALPKINPPADPHAVPSSRHAFLALLDKEDRLTPPSLAQLIAAMKKLCGPAGGERAASVMAAHPARFDPLLLLTPALDSMLGKFRGKPGLSPAAALLWRHCAASLLSRSVHSPAPPADWSQRMKIACNCADCRELQAFSAHPAERVHHFRVNKDRRQHLHRKIEDHGLDMTHVTDRKGSPQTLVCEKTRRRFDLREAQYRADLAAFKTLIAIAQAAACTADPAITQMHSALAGRKRG